MFDPVTQHAVKFHRKKRKEKQSDSDEGAVSKGKEVTVYECPECGTVFKSKKACHEHIVTYHSHFPHGPLKD